MVGRRRSAGGAQGRLLTERLSSLKALGFQTAGFGRTHSRTHATVFVRGSMPDRTLSAELERFGVGITRGTVLETAHDKLLKSFKSTSGSRFNAAKRLENHDRRLTRLTAFASAYVIVLTIFPYFFKLTSGVADLYNFVTVVFSIVILVSSLLQYSSNNIVNAEQHHRSGLEINELQRQLLLLGDSPKAEELSEFTTKYSAILQKYSVNHDTVDHRQFLLDRPEENAWLTRPAKFWIWLQIVMGRATPNVFLIAITSLIIFLIWYGARLHLQLDLP